MTLAKNVLYDDYELFFSKKANSTISFTRKAALDICKHAENYGVLIIGVDPGYWHNPGYQPDMQVSWSGKVKAPVSKEVMIAHNKLAYDDIYNEDKKYTAFMITAVPYDEIPPWRRDKE